MDRQDETNRGILGLVLIKFLPWNADLPFSFNQAKRAGYLKRKAPSWRNHEALYVVPGSSPMAIHFFCTSGRILSAAEDKLKWHGRDVFINNKSFHVCGVWVLEDSFWRSCYLFRGREFDCLGKLFEIFCRRVFRTWKEVLLNDLTRISYRYVQNNLWLSISELQCMYISAFTFFPTGIKIDCHWYCLEIISWSSSSNIILYLSVIFMTSIFDAIR